MVTAGNYSPRDCASLGPCRHAAQVGRSLAVEVVAGALGGDREWLREIRDDSLLDPTPDQGDIDRHRAGVGAPNQTRFVEPERVAGHDVGPAAERGRPDVELEPVG